MNPVQKFLRSLQGQNPEGEFPSGLKITDVTEVSSECREGSLFIAIKGFKVDGHQYIKDAAGRGAKAALVTEFPSDSPAGMAIVKIADTRRAAGPVAQFVAGDPSHHMDVVGVTGTNGKTTSVFLMEAIFKAAGRNPGIMGTVLSRWAGKEIQAKETTPSGPAIARQLGEMKKDRVDAVAFEVSSHAIDQHRVDGIRFRAMGLTNVTQDHLDYHKTMDEYAAVKMAIFDRMREINPDAVGVVNIDDATGRKLAGRLPAKNLLTYAVERKNADLHAEKVSMLPGGLELTVQYRREKFTLRSPMHGMFNAMNCLTATGLGLALGIELGAILEGVSGFKGAPGRFEAVEGLGDIKVFVDYAHTPDALTKLLQNARGMTRNRLIAVFGCGGDRDRTKRPLMGRSAVELADVVVVTSDNPRTEDPDAIIMEILRGASATGKRPPRVEEDRREAIHWAIRNAGKGDVVVIAGKGHEDYQIIGTEKHHFDDREVAREVIREIQIESAEKTGF
ncbi:UDP-N-acetylmuramoyl-L-alanyl-D-glutamate--2,6-diaminopimelate ligase [Candidatus Sumerlaeota bacterium]|nr:UDP-N-acetylmuramoyl-L-alanyl-D-glutamate--2,6-diaminopimelate ligase [Candidatus Sumerlaeota bacterium]